jgi:hypothetical protein
MQFRDILMAAAQSGGFSYDADTNAWETAVVGAGGSVSAARKGQVNTLILGLKADGVWTLLDRLWLFAAESSTQALRDLVARSAATAVDNPTFTTDRGFTGNGSSSYINTGYVPSTHKVALAQDSAHLSLYTTAFTTNAVFGFGGANPQLHIHAPFSDGKFYARMNANGGAGKGAALTTGLYIGDRSAAGAIAYARNGADIGTDTEASTGVPSSALYIGAMNDNGTAAGFDVSRHGAASIGGSLGAAGRAALSSRLNAYMSAIGASVY